MPKQGEMFYTLPPLLNVKLLWFGPLQMVFPYFLSIFYFFLIIFFLPTEALFCLGVWIMLIYAWMSYPRIIAFYIPLKYWNMHSGIISLTFFCLGRIWLESLIFSMKNEKKNLKTWFSFQSEPNPMSFSFK